MKRAIAIFLIMAFVAAFADNPHVTQLIELLDVAISSPQDGDVLTFDAAAGKWINKPAARPQRIDFNGLAGNQTSIPLFTPDETASYRVTMTNMATVNSGAIMVLSNSQFSVGLLAQPGAVGPSTVFRATAGDTVSFSGEQSGPQTGGTYDLHFTVEKL